MIKNRNDFFNLLWEDYISFDIKDRDKCFVYKYFKKKKDARAEVIGRSRDAVMEYAKQKKHDKYILLKSAYLAMVENQVLTRDEYVAIFEKLIGKNKIPNKYRNLHDATVIAEVQQTYERRFLIGCVCDFFYNIGYRTNKYVEHSQSVKLPSKHLKEDGYNDEFEMLHDYMKYSNSDFTKPVETDLALSINEEYIEKCIQLYNTVLKEKRTTIFVPLYIDPNTGAGVYIIGRDKCNKGAFGNNGKNFKEPCLVCIAGFYSVENVMNNESDSNVEVEIIMLVNQVFNSVSKAFDSFKSSLSTNDFYKEYPLENDDSLPNGIDKHFHPYFTPQNRTDISFSTAQQAMLEKEEKAKESILEEERCRNHITQNHK